MEKIKIKLLIIPKFEVGEMSGDDIGEAQLFYEEYCREAAEYTLRFGYTLHVNENNGVALGLSHAGKTNTLMFCMAVMEDSRFDFSEAYIMAVGCGGGAYGVATMGDVAIIRAAVDFENGYQATVADGDDAEIMWFENPDTVGNAYRILNRDLADRIYGMTKDITLETTPSALAVLKRNFPGEEWAARQPRVITGTSVSSDAYWKGRAEHFKALKIAEAYGCPDPYTITEMEDSACAVIMDGYGMLSRLIIIRAAVNVDVFIDNADAESTWSRVAKYEDNVTDANEENLDIFVPAMRNLFKVGKIIADSVLDGTISG